MDSLEVRMHNGTPTVFVNDDPIWSAIYLTAAPFPVDDSGQLIDRHYEQFSRIGFELFSISIQQVISFDKAYDPRNGEFRPEVLGRIDGLRKYRAINPNAKFLLRVGMEPRGVDSPWIRQHPDECEVLEARGQWLYKTPSYASEAWLSDSDRYVRALIATIHELDLDDAIFGYLICGGDSAEWVKAGAMEDLAGDYSPPMQQAFRAWLQKRYGGDEKALRESWADPDAAFDQDLVPSPEEQAGTDLLLFKDPRRRRKAVDYFQCLASVVADDIDRLCGAAKDACGRNHLAGVFYGYLLEIVWSNGFFGQGRADADVHHSAGARSGHAGLNAVLASANVDFLSSPYSYGFRGVGGEGGFMAPYESVRRAGKLWISEEDMRTHRWAWPSYYGQTRNVGETCEVLKRQTANIIISGAGGWWCDWARGNGAFDDPETMSVFERSLQIGQHSLSLSDRSSAAEVAVVVDAESFFYRSTKNNFDIPNWRNRAWGIARMGAPVDFVLLSDLLDGRAGDYKFYIMTNVFHVDAAARETLKSLLRRNGSCTLWIYAAGLSSDTISVNNSRDLTGIGLQLTEREWGAHVYISNFGHPVTRNLATSTFWGTDMHLGPLFTVDDPEAVTLGNVVINQGRCEPGFVLREDTLWSSAYSAAPNIPAAVLRELGRHAGVHVYSDHDDVLYANNAYVMVHTVRTESKTIHLPQRSEVREVYSNRLVSRDCTEFRDTVEAGKTCLYYYGQQPGP